MVEACQKIGLYRQYHGLGLGRLYVRMQDIENIAIKYKTWLGI